MNTAPTFSNGPDDQIRDRLTKQELLDLIDDVNATVSAVLARHLILTEGLAGGRSQTTRNQIELLKLKLAAAHDRLHADLKADQVQKKSAELKKEGIAVTGTPLPIKNASGTIIGWVRKSGGQLQIWDNHGRLIFRVG